DENDPAPPARSPSSPASAPHARRTRTTDSSPRPRLSSRNAHGRSAAGRDDFRPAAASARGWGIGGSTWRYSGGVGAQSGASIMPLHHEATPMKFTTLIPTHFN